MHATRAPRGALCTAKPMEGADAARIWDALKARKEKLIFVLVMVEVVDVAMKAVTKQPEVGLGYASDMEGANAAKLRGAQRVQKVTLVFASHMVVAGGQNFFLLCL